MLVSVLVLILLGSIGEYVSELACKFLHMYILDHKKWYQCTFIA